MNHAEFAHTRPQATRRRETSLDPTMDLAIDAYAQHHRMTKHEAMRWLLGVGLDTETTRGRA